MDADPEQRAIADKILEAIRRECGFVPVINQIMGTRPDILIPMSRASKAILHTGAMDRKQKTLCAISAATAAGGEYCVDVQIKEALAAGATQDEIFEAVMIGSYMCMTKAQSYALRKYASNFDIELERLRSVPEHRLNAVKRIYTDVGYINR